MNVDSKIWDALIRKYTGDFQVPFDLAKAQMLAESSGEPTVVSSAGAIGLFQIEPGTAKSLLYQPEVNVFLGIYYLNFLYRFVQTFASDTDRWKLALASYDAGPGRVREAQQTAAANTLDAGQYENVKPNLPQETIEYVNRIWSEYLQAANPEA